MLIMVHQDGDHLDHQQRREFLSIFICNLKMDGRNIPIIPSISLKNSRNLSQTGKEEGQQDGYQAEYQVHCNGPKEKHPSSGYRWRLSLLEKTLLCLWWRCSPAWWTLGVIQASWKFKYIHITSATHPYPLVIHWLSTLMFCSHILAEEHCRTLLFQQSSSIK